MRSPVRSALAAALILAALAPAAPAQVVVPGSPADAVMSPNVEYLGSIKDDLGVTAGARIIGNRMYVTSGKNLSIYDITNPAVPVRVGQLRVNISWENEEVPTNGKILGFGSDFYNASPDGGCLQALAVDGCSQFFDIRDPANIKELPAVPEANHTMECVNDCDYFWGSSGSIIDARGALSGTPAKVVGSWRNAARAQGVASNSCHNIREIAPGVVLTACQPFSVLSIRAEDGGTPLEPKVLAFGRAAKFVHSSRWPRGGKDKFVMTGGEENFTARCELNNSEFSTYSAEKVLSGESDEFELLEQIGPAGNGAYVDGKPVAGALGCSVHWFQEHESFKDGGLVALSEYEDGVRFMQIEPDGDIVEQGYFVGLGSSSSSPKWAPDGRTLYSIDYQRGIDILRWKGERYVPTASGKVKREKARVRGTNGTTPASAWADMRLSATGRAALMQRLRVAGWKPGD